jgi:hypothetical protein
LPLPVLALLVASSLPLLTLFAAALGPHFAAWLALRTGLAVAVSAAANLGTAWSAVVALRDQDPLARCLRGGGRDRGQHRRGDQHSS